MGERNRDARQQAEADGQEHYWHEESRADDSGRKWRIRKRISLAALRREEDLKERAQRENGLRVEDDGTIVTGQTAIDALNASIDVHQELRQRLAREHPDQWARYCQAKGYADAPPVRVLRTTPQGRAPREATNTRSRGSRRGTRTSSSSDDPDDLDSARICEWCGRSIAHLRADARHCNGAHKARAWRRDKAERGLVRDASQVDGDVDVVRKPCGCVECRRARNGVYDVDRDVLNVWIEQVDENRHDEPDRPVRPPRLTNGIAPSAMAAIAVAHYDPRAPAGTGGRGERRRTDEFISKCAG